MQYHVNIDSNQLIGVSERQTSIINVDATRPAVNRPILNLENIEICNDIIICHNVVSRKLCNEIIQGSETWGRLNGGQNMWTKALTVGEGTSEKDRMLSPRQNLVMSIPTDDNKIKSIDDIIWHVFHKTREITSSRFLMPHGFNLIQDEGYQLLRYEKSNYYKEHTDYNNNLVRTLSGLLYLNDDYEGGEINFRRQGVCYKPSIGDVIFFPSAWTHPHTAMPVIEGIRYNIVTWWR